MARHLTAIKCPSDVLSLTNCAIVSPKDFAEKPTKEHLEIVSGSSTKHVFTYKVDSSVPQGSIGFGAVQRKWAMIMVDQKIHVTPYAFDLKNNSIGAISLEVDYLTKKSVGTTDSYDTDKMAIEFLFQFANQAFTVGQQFAFQLQDQNKRNLLITVKELQAVDYAASIEGKAPKARKLTFGQLLPNSAVVFEKAENTTISLTGKCKGKSAQQVIFNPDWDFTKMGIGGLDKEFDTIFRRAFVSRVYPPEIREEFDLKHVKGILLFGPPGTGKTLMARQIGKMLNAREPKIVNGPEILDKYVGESEANIRKLFAEAEEEEKKLGPNSGLHIIIFDEFEAICKQRGSAGAGSGVHDTVVNQLLTKIDGVDQLNNVLLIGMTNRRDMIDEAILRPGRFEVQMEISLPDETGRLQILKIHTDRIRENKRLSSEVDLAELAASTKNFSGAELAGLVRAAQSRAMSRPIKGSSKVNWDEKTLENLKITREDFIEALSVDIKPAFGFKAEDFDLFMKNGIINWGDPVAKIIDEGELSIKQTRESDMTPLVSILLEGDKKSGKTALAAKIALNSNFPFIKFCTPQSLAGYSETSKSQAIKKIFDDAYKSELSCIVIDNIEAIIEYVPIGPRFSNVVLQTLLIYSENLPPKGHRLLLIATTSNKRAMKDLGLQQCFSSVENVSNLRTGTEVLTALEQLDSFSKSEMDVLTKKLKDKAVNIGIKSLINVVEKAKKTEESYRMDKFLSEVTNDDYDVRVDY